MLTYDERDIFILWIELLIAKEVIEHYNSGVQAHPNLSPTLRQGNPNGGPPNPNGAPRQLNLTEMEKVALLRFMETLTDEVFSTDEKFSNPFSD